MSDAYMYLLTHDEHGGAMNIWEQVADGLRAKGKSASLVVLYRKADVPSPGWQFCTRRKLSAGALLAAFAGLWRLIGQVRPRAMLSAQPMSNIVAPWVGFFRRVPVRLISHHTPVDTYGRWQRLADRITASLPVVTHVVCVSAGVRASLDGYPASYLRKTVVITNALSPQVKTLIGRVLQGPRPPARAPGEPLKIVASGRLAEQKNYLVLIRAMKDVRGAVLHILGEGPQEAEMRALIASLGLQDRIVLHGRLEHEPALTFMRDCDLFIQPSLFEGHSIALLEAAELGLPMIVSDVVTQVEAVRTRDGQLHAAIAPVSDPEAMGRVIAAVVADDAKRAQLREGARLIAAEATFPRLVQSYGEVIAK